MLEVLYATVLEPDLIGELVEVPPERIRLIEKSGAAEDRRRAVVGNRPRRRRPAPLPRQRCRARRTCCRSQNVPLPERPRRVDVPAGETTIRLNVTVARLPDDPGRRAGAQPQPIE